MWRELKDSYLNSPDTLGGLIRAARENLQLSLAEVADGHYSTSLAARIGVHVHLGHHLLKIGKIAESEQELEQARHLSDLVSTGASAVSMEDVVLL